MVSLEMQSPEVQLAVCQLLSAVTLERVLLHAGNRQMLFERLGMIYFILICFLDILILYLSVNYFLRIQDKWKRKYAETPSGYNLFLGILLPTLYSLFIILPSIVVPREFIKRFPLNIHELWAVIPIALMLFYFLIYKSEEVSKVYSKVDKRKLDG